MLLIEGSVGAREARFQSSVQFDGEELLVQADDSRQRLLGRLLGPDAWDDRIHHPASSGWLRVLKRGHQEDVRQILDELAEDFPAAYVVPIDGARCRDVPSALETLAAALDFPEYYGHNADAFIECFRDYLAYSSGRGLGSEFDDGRAGVPAQALILVVTDSGDLLLDQAEAGRSRLEGIINFALDTYTDDPVIASGEPANAGSTEYTSPAGFAVLLVPGSSR